MHSKFTALWLSWFDIYDTMEGKNQHILSPKLSSGYTKECLIWPKALSICSTTQKARYWKYDPNKFLIKDRKYRNKFFFELMLWDKKTQQIEVLCSLANSLFLTRKTFLLLSVIQSSLGCIPRPRVAFNKVQWICFVSCIFITSIFIKISHFIKWEHFSHFKRFERDFSLKLILSSKNAWTNATIFN